jgi:RNA polymerase sigma factor (TIGR02999 family)
MPPDVTQLLDAIESGDPQAADELLPLVYSELRKVAAARMSGEQAGQTLQATALVHEAWIRLAGSDQQWNGRAHVFRAAAEAMRRILVDKARRKATMKRGEGVKHEELHESRIELNVPTEKFFAVNDAVDELERKDELAAWVVKLRYFVGMDNEEVAEALGISVRSVQRHWVFARAWLKGVIKKQ